MTGTAATEAAEFAEIYRLSVVEIPTHRQMVRKDEDDEVYRSAREKNDAIIEEIQSAHAKAQPVLVGTVSIEKSEHLSDLLKAKRVPHQVLNARYHEQEAHIIAQAGRIGAVTIATNMAGRGTDIQLGGNADMRLAQELADDERDGPKAERRSWPRSRPSASACATSAACSSSAPSGTRAAASTTSCAAAPAARAIPAARSSS